MIISTLTGDLIISVKASLTTLLMDETDSKILQSNTVIILPDRYIAVALWLIFWINLPVLTLVIFHVLETRNCKYSLAGAYELWKYGR